MEWKQQSINVCVFNTYFRTNRNRMAVVRMTTLENNTAIACSNNQSNKQTE